MFMGGTDTFDITLPRRLNAGVTQYCTQASFRVYFDWHVIHTLRNKVLRSRVCCGDEFRVQYTRFRVNGRGLTLV